MKRSIRLGALPVVVTAIASCVPEAPTGLEENLRPAAAIATPADGAEFGAGEPVELAGSATDPEDGPLPGSSLRWTSSLDGELGSGPSLFVDDLAVGAHRIRLIATDSRGASDTAGVSIGIAVPANRPPTAAMVSPVNGAEFLVGESVAFQGTASDPEDGVLPGSSLSWESSLDGPIGTGLLFTRDDLTAGSHEIRLIAVDGDGAADTAFASIGIGEPANLAPSASFSFGCTNLLCRFTDGSADPDGTVVAWSWDFGDGTGSEARNPEHVYEDEGTFDVELTVTDDDGATDVATRRITVVAANEGPDADFQVSCALLTCSFTDLSTDSDGAVVAWSWDFGDGTTSTERNPEHTYTTGGARQVTLVVTDDDGATGQASRTVEVNERPVADFAFSCEDVLCQFADQSSDPDGTVVAWSWNFGDGTTSTQRDPAHEYAEGGTYTVTLTVTDDDGASDAASKSVPVTANAPPTADFVFSCEDLACAFTDASADADGTVVAWRWDFGDGATSTGQNPTHSYADEGTYVVTLTVTDDDGAASAPAARSVSVEAPNRPPTATILAPADGSIWDGDDNVQFRGEASDPDGDETTLEWRSDRDGPFGTGTVVNTKNLREGEHRITLVASDGELTGTDTITIRIEG